MSNRILSYKGLMASGAIETILLSTNKGEKGYRIVKFELLAKNPGTVAQENVLKIYKDEQSTADAEIDFSDNRLLAAGYYQDSTSAGDNQAVTVIFDNEIFNQDIYITNFDISGNDPGIACNYYLELEVIKLSESQAMVATLKDIRNND
jgi:hypothetical protein